MTIWSLRKSGSGLRWHGSKGHTEGTAELNYSGKAFHTIHSSDFSFFEEINRVVQAEADCRPRT
jgi:hypothetical protein